MHEDIDDEVKSFKEYMTGDVYLDADKGFYHALGNRWAGLGAIFSPKMWKNGISSYKDKDVKGNLKGEGRLLGGVMVIPPSSKIPSYVHQEAVFGEFAPPDEVKAALCNALNIAVAPQHAEKTQTQTQTQDLGDRVLEGVSPKVKIVCTEDACSRA